MRHTFACSDLHGMIDIYEQIKNFIGKDDIVYFLGDAADRGEENWNTLKKIMMDPQFIYLKGNHENMLQTTMKDFIVNGETDYHNYSILTQNGGNATYQGWLKEASPDKILWYHRISNLPLWLTYDNKDGKKIFLSHAGFVFDINEKGKPIIPEAEELLWDRSHYFCKTTHDIPENWMMVHGHTPIEYLFQDLRWQFGKEETPEPKYPMAYWYDNHRKCCIDNGCFYTYCTVLLDLDTFEEHKFFDKEYDADAIRRG